MKTIKYHVLMLILFSLILRGDTCGSDSGVVKDPSFDAWASVDPEAGTGDSEEAAGLVSWVVDEGEIGQAPTWHSEDLAVELIGSPVQISQELSLRETGGQCLSFKLISDVESSSEVWVGIDFTDDGVVDFQHRLSSGRFLVNEFKVAEPTWFYRARLIIRKEGQGRAILAEMDIHRREGGCAGEPLKIENPDGSPCSDGSDCVSGSCEDVSVFGLDGLLATEKRCSSCSNNRMCDEGKVCGQSSPSEVGNRLSCEAPAAMGEACISGEACESGICCEGVCSQCCDGGGCAPGESCKENDGIPFPLVEMPQEEDQIVSAFIGNFDVLPTEEFSLPFQCSPGEGLRNSGEGCWVDADCGSGVCESASVLKVCLHDRRPCESRMDCDDIRSVLFPGFPLVEDESNPINACVPLGEYGGICQ